MPRTGRPRTFDRDAAVRQAMHLFWEHGYSSTSLAVLKENLGGGIAATSFYAAFGSKEALFREALDLYVASHGTASAPLFDPTLGLQDAVGRTLMQSALMQTGEDHPRGCFLVAAANGCAPGDDHIARLLAERRAESAKGFRACVDRAIARGELAPETDREVLAAVFQTFLLGLTTQARDGVTAQLLASTVAEFMRWWTQAIGWKDRLAL